MRNWKFLELTGWFSPFVRLWYSIQNYFLDDTLDNDISDGYNHSTDINGDIDDNDDYHENDNDNDDNNYDNANDDSDDQKIIPDNSDIEMTAGYRLMTRRKCSRTWSNLLQLIRRVLNLLT